MGRFRFLNIKETFLNKPEGLDIVLSLLRVLFGRNVELQAAAIPVQSGARMGVKTN